MVKPTVERKENTWKEPLGARNEVTREICIEAYKEKKVKV